MKSNPQGRWGTYQLASDDCHSHTDSDDCHSHTDAVDFMVTMISATICSSGQDYNGAIERFFPQLQALGEMINARGLDDVSACLRGTSTPG